MSENEGGVMFEQGEGTVARLRNRLAEVKGKLDIILREGTGESPDSLAADYGGTDWEKSKEVQAIRAERGRAAKAEEELAHVRRELAEMKGQDAAEETSGTLAIYESFKTALEPFGHDHLNVRARIECLVEHWKGLRIERDKPRAVDQIHVERFKIEIEKWRTACKTAQTERLRLIRAVLGIPHPQPFPDEIRDPFEAAMELCKQVHREMAEETATALRLLGDALFQLQGAGVSHLRLNPPMGDGAKHDLIRVLQLSMGEDTVEDIPVRKLGVGIGVVCFQEGRILLGRRHPDLDGGCQWELPGGSLEWGESWDEAARREVEEETGIVQLTNYRFVTAKQDYRPDEDKHNAVIFVRFDAYGQAKIKEPDKSTEWGWYLLDKLPDGPMFPALAELLTADKHLLA